MRLTGPAAPGMLRYRLGLHRPFYLWASLTAKRTLPKPVYSLAARCLGAQARWRATTANG